MDVVRWNIKRDILVRSMPKKSPYIIKASGDKARFSRRRLFTSLVRSGAPKHVANSVTDKVASEIQDGVSTTHDIYSRAYGLLKEMKQQPVAGRYSLKKSIMALGPTGYPFETFFGEILKRLGYEVQVGVVLDGFCVPHEVDVVAIKDDVHALVEAKFHNQPGVHTDVKVPLYIHSRFQDIEKQLKLDGDNHKTHEPWVVTNTHFTSSAIAYGECMGMRLIGWRYPETGGLETMIEDAGLHPITCLPSLPEKVKNQLLKQNMLLCQDVLEQPQRLTQLGMSETKARSILTEAKNVCSLH